MESCIYGTRNGLNLFVCCAFLFWKAKKYCSDFDSDDFAEVCGVLGRLVFAFQVPAFIRALDCNFHGVKTILVVDGIDGCCETGLLGAVNRVEEDGLYCRVGGDAPMMTPAFL